MGERLIDPQLPDNLPVIHLNHNYKGIEYNKLTSYLAREQERIHEVRKELEMLEDNARRLNQEIFQREMMMDCDRDRIKYRIEYYWVR